MWSLTGAVVGEPTLGPTVFMHRASSEGNPTAPLSHHTADSTHITHGVIAAGLTRGTMTVEGSVFHGREPDENRLDIEMGKLDSYAGRVWYRTGPWAAQVSAGHLTQPDATELSDLDRYTASVEYAGKDTPLKFTALFGMNHLPNLNGSNVNEYAWLTDVAWRLRSRDLAYLRAEIVDKDILQAGEIRRSSRTPSAVARRRPPLGYQRRCRFARQHRPRRRRLGLSNAGKSLDAYSHPRSHLPDRQTTSEGDPVIPINVLTCID